MLRGADSGSHKEKRKHTNETPIAETPRKRLLSDAFDGLSILNPQLKKHALSIAHNTTTSSLKDNATSQGAQICEDTEMRSPSSWSPSHTVFIDSLDDDADPDPLDLGEAKFLFDLPGRIDTTFAGSKGIPKELFASSNSTQATQMVLYRGPAEEIISRTIKTSNAAVAGSVGDDRAWALPSPGSYHIDGDAMDLD